MAQWKAHWTSDPGVVGSTPTGDVLRQIFTVFFVGTRHDGVAITLPRRDPAGVFVIGFRERPARYPPSAERRPPRDRVFVVSTIVVGTGRDVSTHDDVTYLNPPRSGNTASRRYIRSRPTSRAAAGHRVTTTVAIRTCFFFSHPSPSLTFRSKVNCTRCCGADVADNRSRPAAGTRVGTLFVKEIGIFN